MSRQYRALAPRKVTAEIFDVNTSGAALLGELHKRAGIPVNCPKGEDWPPSTMFSATARDSREAFLRISSLTDTELKLLLDTDGVRGLWGGTADDFVLWVREWEDWLLGCGGYEVE